MLKQIHNQSAIERARISSAERALQEGQQAGTGEQQASEFSKQVQRKHVLQQARQFHHLPPSIIFWLHHYASEAAT